MVSNLNSQVWAWTWSRTHFPGCMDWLRSQEQALLLQRTGTQYLAPMSGNSQLPLTPIPGSLTPSSSNPSYLHSHTCTYWHTEIIIIIKTGWLWWHTSFNTAFGRQNQWVLTPTQWASGQPGLQSETLSKNKTTKENKWLTTWKLWLQSYLIPRPMLYNTST